MSKDAGSRAIRNAPDAPAPANDDGSRKSNRGRRSYEAELLGGVEFWRTPDDVAMASVPLNRHLEHVRVRSSAFRNHLVGTNYRITGGGLSGTQQRDLIDLAEARALAASETRIVWRRVAEAEDGAVLIDLGGSNRHGERRAVRITGEGWNVLEAQDVSVMFVRPADALSLPEPVADEANWRSLTTVINVDEHGAQLLWSWILCAVRPFRGAGAYPILVVHGEQGSGKTWATRCLQMLIDPSTSMGRALPREERDLYVSATTRHVLGFDNVSNVGSVLSDAFCRIGTGGTYSGRALHTDADEVNLTVLRPLLLNGIPLVAGRPDLADRTIAVQLHVLPDRRQDAELQLEFERMRPALLGLVCDGISSALRRLASTKITADLRMRDAVAWAEAAAEGLGIEAGCLQGAWLENREGLDAQAIEGDPVAAAVTVWFEARGEVIVKGQPRDIFAEIGRAAGDGQNSKYWPRSASAMGAHLKRIAPSLRRVKGISFATSKGGKDSFRAWTFFNVRS